MKTISRTSFKIVTTILTILSFFLYIPVNRLITGGYNLHIQVDEYIPLLPVFVIPYLFGLVFWLSTIIFVQIKEIDIKALLFNIKMATASLVSVIIYITIPTYVTRPIFDGSDIFSKILNFVYSNDHIYNAAPSGHTFFTLLCLFQLSSLFPKYKLLWILLSVLIIASTVLTKQHNILDIVIGIIFALVINYGINTLSKSFTK